MRNKPSHTNKNQQQYSNELFRSIWNYTKDGMRLTNHEGIIIDANNSYCELVKMNREELIGKPLGIVYDRSSSDLIFDAYRKRCSTNTLTPYFEKSFRLWNENEIWFGVSTSTIEDNHNGKIILSVFRDITLQKEYEKELIESKEKYYNAIQSLPLGCAILNPEGKIKYVNNTFTEIFGYTTEDIPDSNEWFLKAYPDPEYRKYVKTKWEKDIDRLLKNGSNIIPFYFDVTTKTGEIKNIEFRQSFLDNEVLVTFNDITEREYAWNRLDYYINRLESISNISSDVVGDLPLKETVTKMLEELIKAFDVDAAVIRILKDDGLILLSKVNVPDESIVEILPADFGIAGTITRTKKAEKILNTKTNDITKGINTYHMNSFKFISYAGAPLLIKNRVFGLIGLYTTTNEKDFSSEDLSHLQIAANQIASVVENNKLFTELSNRNIELENEIQERIKAEEQVFANNRHLSMLINANESLIKIFNLQEIMQTLTNTACNLLDVGSAAIYQLKNGELYLGATTPPLPDDFPEILRQAKIVDHPHIKQVLSSKKLLVIPDFKTAVLSESERQIGEMRRLRTIVFIPLLGSRNIVGVLIVGTVDEPHDIPDSSIAICQTLATQASISIENALLYQSAQKEIEERKRTEEALIESQKNINLFFSQSLEGFYLTKFEEPQYWNENIDKEKILDYSLNHQIFIDANDTFLNQYNTTRDEIVGKPISAFLKHNIEFGQDFHEQLFDKGKMHVETLEKKADNTPIWIEGEYICLYDELGRITGTFGAQRDITQRKIAENELLKSLTRNEALLNANPDMMFLFDADCRILDYHSHGEDKLYNKPEIFIGKIITDVLPSDAAIIAKERINGVFKTGIPNQYLYKLEINKKELIFEARLVKCGENEVLSIVRDITEQKLAEDELKLQKDRYRNIIEGTNVGTWEWNVQTGETIFNERWAEIAGYSLEEISPVSIETWVKLAHLDDLELSNKALQKHFNGELDSYEFECRMKHKNGEWIWVLDRGKVISWTADKKPLWMYGTHQDITDRKKADDLLLESEMKYRSIIEGLNDTITILDENGMIKFQSPSAYKLFGYTEAEMVGKDPFNFIHPDDRYLVRKDLTEVFYKTNKSIPTLFRVVNKSGRHIYIETIGKNMLDNKSVNGIVIFGKDVTEKIKAERELEQQNKDLTNINNFAIELTKLTYQDNYEEFINKKLKEITNSDFAIFSEYNDEKRTLMPLHIELESGIVEKVVKLLGKQIKNAESYVSDEIYKDMITNSIGRFNSLYDAVLESMPRPVASAIQSLIKGDKFIAIAYVMEGKLYGTSLISFTKNKQDPTDLVLRNFILLTSSFLQRRKAIFEKEESQKLFEASIAQSPAGILIAEAPDVKIRWANSAAIEMRGNTDDQLINIDLNLISKNWQTFKPDGTNYPPEKLPLARAILEGITIRNEEVILRNEAGENRWVSANAAPILGNDNKVKAGIAIFQDITEKKITEENLKNSLIEKEVLLKEVHHRVKNNFQLINNMLNLESDMLNDEKIISIFGDLQHRIRSLSLVHEILYSTLNFASINFYQYVKDLISYLQRSFFKAVQSIEIELDIDEIEFEPDIMIPCGIIINELVTNAVKYAFPATKKGKITVSMKRKEDKHILKITDNGVGLPDDFDIEKTISFGLYLVKTLSRQLDGKLDISSSKKGSSFTITF